MLAKKNWTKILALAFVALYLLYKACLETPSSALELDLLDRRPWVERMSLDPREHIHGMFFHDDKGASFYGSQYHVELTMFEFAASGDTLKIHYLQKDEKVEYRARAWKCDNAPKPFNLCLEMSTGGKTTKLFSRTEWRVKDFEDLQSLSFD